MNSALLLWLGNGVLAFMAVPGAGPQIAREDHIDVLSVTDLPATYDPLWAEYQRRRDPEDAALAEKTSTDAWIGTRRRLLHPSLFSDPSE